jgi:hypothetical protein
VPTTALPEAVNHSALITALAIIRIEVESRQEDVTALGEGAKALHDRLVNLADELGGLKVDVYTIGNVHAVADAVAGQAAAAITYASRTDESAVAAHFAARTATRNHAGIEEAVNDAPVAMAVPAFYGE